MTSLESAENERRVVSQVESWQRDSTGARFDSLLQPNIDTLRQVADRVCLAEFRNQQAAAATSQRGWRNWWVSRWPWRGAI